MKKLIDKEYVKDDIAQLMLGTKDNEIVMSDDEIILLKVDGKVIINKYLQHPKKDEFPYSDVPMHINKDRNVELYNILFEMNKNYLVYELGDLGDNVIMNRFSKVENGALWNNEVAEHPDEDDFEVYTYTREEMEKIFDGQNYDSMIIVDKRGKIMVACSKKDGEVIKTDMLPSKEEELANKGDSVLLYGGLTFQHTMITSKDGVFKVFNFSLTLDRDGTYVMDTQDIVLPDVSFVENLDIPRVQYERTGSVSIK